MIVKAEWDSIAEERIRDACDPAKTAEVAVVVLQEGLAHVTLVTGNMTIIRAKIEASIPRKRKNGLSSHGTKLTSFYEQVLTAIMAHVDFSIVKAVVLGSPGFVKDALWTYIQEQAVRRELKVILENKSKFLLGHCSSGHKHAIREVLADPAIMARLEDTKASKEVSTLNQFFEILASEPDRVAYGVKSVMKANEASAVASLMVTDELFRAADIVTRRTYVGLVESVRKSGGEVFIFSALHTSGEQLGQLTGVAAILRFPMPGLDDVVEGDSDSDSDTDSDSDGESWRTPGGGQAVAGRKAES